MTKKFIHSNKEINGKNSRIEFLIPDIFENRPRLIGLQSGKAYEFGMIVYTGVNLDGIKIIDKLTKHRVINEEQKEKYIDVLNQYLHQIKEIKIGKVVRLMDDFKLVER